MFLPLWSGLRYLSLSKCPLVLGEEPTEGVSLRDATDTFDFLEDTGLGEGEGPGSALGHDVRAVHDDLAFLDHVG